MIAGTSQPPIIAALSPCGLTANDVTVRYDDELQSTIVTINRSTNVDASKFLCIRQASWAKADIEFQDFEVGRLYQAFDDELGRSEGRAAARAWLRQRGMLDRLPTFASGETASSAMAKVATFCGIKPGDAFEQRYPGMVSIRESFLRPPIDVAVDCLFHTMAAIDTEQLDFKFGFVGNEAFSEEKN